VKPRVAIATGDPAGIGPEISLKAAADPQVLAMCEPVLIDGRGPVAALDAAETAIRGALEGRFDAVVAAPHVEATIHAAGVAFDGYPSFVARVCGLPPEDGVLMLCFTHRGRDIRIAHVTLHASVRQALDQISAPRILRTLQAAHLSLRNLGIERPRLAVGGVNPHAGEGGLFGDEEARHVVPAIEAAKKAGIEVDGPYGADTLMQREEYDAFVVMLHDQGHVAAKLLAPNRVAALTIGTPVLFSSVAHGAALDIAGRGQADPAAMVAAIARLVGGRRRAA
jgi:4-hydroxythreonine-4-phosphate dehydrogenase